MAVNLEAAPADTIVVLRALGLGDLLTAVPALRGLRRHYRDGHIVLAAPERYRELATLTGAVDDVLPTARLGDARPLAQPPALAINLHGCGPQSIDHLLTWQPRQVITHRHSSHPAFAGPPWCADVHDVQRWCALLEWAGIQCHCADVTLPRPPAVGREHTGAIVIHPGASAAARRWPAERFAAVAAALREDGYEIVFSGSGAEFGLAHDVARAAGLPRSAVVAGMLDLVALAALLSDSRLVICGDTGVAHLAAATATASVVLFGPTSPAHWGPRSPVPHVALWAGECGDPHADEPHPGLLSITVPAVLQACRGLLGEGR